MSQPYYCKLCGRLDEEGITGHATTRCKPLGMVANVVANKKVVANNVKKVAASMAKTKARMGAAPSIRTKDRHKNREARLEYARNLMRKRRAEAKAAA